MENNLVVQAKDVVKTYDEGRVQALNGVNLDVVSASFIALAGPSGSGKTTLLNIIGALDIPDSGSVGIEGRNLESMKEKERTTLRRERIGFIFQQFNLVPVLTARENVELPLEILPGFDRAARKKTALEMLSLVGLEGLENRFPNKLSGGQQQRVAVARALVKSPAIILADEPTANLDSENGMAIVDLMKKMRDELGSAFILSSHDPRVLERVERVVQLVDGRIDQ
ncbi:MAG: ABC transporter ATP-binding protein [Candidatus Electryonea clarkiae]|nr:ABC transporter ATP-binding protein [Candidatus Electryonea clarkiae]MDP8288107.1 ABC transporter ATP-binding protein [Candidatus Electryonea clarkiae]